MRAALLLPESTATGRRALNQGVAVHPTAPPVAAVLRARGESERESKRERERHSERDTAREAPPLMEAAAALVAAEAANPSNVDIDALPYVDQQMENIDQMKAYVDHLVAEEMKTFAPRDYLSHMPEPELKFLERPMLKAELERVQAGGEMAKMDTTRYAVAPPAEDRASDPAAWKQAVGNAKAQLEHNVVRGENLELLRDHGPAYYQEYGKYLDSVQQGMGAQRDDLKRKIDELNRERKAEQVGAAERLHGLDQKWKTMVFGNRQIEEACIAMEADIKRIKGETPS